jgi:hypothetical protein
MAFPTSPTNGQQALLNGITYQYSSTTNAWTRIPINIFSNYSANTIITANSQGYLANSGNLQYFSSNNTLIALNSASQSGNLVANSLYVNYLFFANTGLPVTANGSGNLTGIIGNTNQIIVTGPVLGQVTLGTPQNLNPSANIRFGIMAIGNTFTNLTGNAANVISNSYYGLTSGGIYANTVTLNTSLGVGTAAPALTGGIYATNNIVAFYSSDISLKENVAPIQNALVTTMAIGGKTFDWTDSYISQRGGIDGYFVQKSDFGVIAQDVQKVFPVAVRTKLDGTLAVDYEKLVALAFQAIVELKQEVEELKAKLPAN